MAEYTVSTQSTMQTKAALSQFMSRVYNWMVLGLILSALTSYYVASNQALVTTILQSKGIFFTLIFAQLGVVLAFSFLINRISATAAKGLFIIYTLLTGTTLSVIFLMYTMQSIMSTFLITAASFAGLSFFGYVTKRDLGPLGTFAIMGLWGLIIVMFAAMFFPSLRSDTMQLTIAALGVLVFSGLTAYDTQKIKMMYLQGQSQNSQIIVAKQAIFGALNLYLDFINLFLSLLRLIGGRR